ncbi:pilin [Edwardsiella piscicida]|uniref:pilin n=1 Tax=Edwardsiella piscicida TaxID=1263550 RepID=UPI00370D41FA
MNMTKTLVSAFVAASCLAASGAAMARYADFGESNPYVKSYMEATLTTNVIDSTTTRIVATPSPFTVSTTDASRPGTALATLSINAMDIIGGDSGKSDVRVDIHDDYYDDASQNWLFKNDNGDTIKVRPQGDSGTWSSNGGRNIAAHTTGLTDLNSEVQFVTVQEDGNIAPGSYSMPVVATINSF